VLLLAHYTPAERRLAFAAAAPPNQLVVPGFHGYNVVKNNNRVVMFDKRVDFED
jgi:hypothetical protein